MPPLSLLLSLDGNRTCHDRFRKDSVGRGTYDQAVKVSAKLCICLASPIWIDKSLAIHRKNLRLIAH